MLACIAQLLVQFAEPDFPAVGGPDPPVAVEDALTVESTEALAAELAPELATERVLVWRHGAAFPAEVWPALVRFLEQGGSLLHLGGEPFTRPVVGPPGARVVQPRTVSALGALRLNQSYALPAGGLRLVRVPREGPGAPVRVLGSAATVYALEPRLADTRDFAHEDGAPGARDALLAPLFHLLDPRDEARFPAAAAAVAIDRLRGRFAGGRWVLWLLSEAPAPDELATLVEHATRDPVDFRVDPTFGCFRPGEAPSVVVRVHRPRAEGSSRLACRLELRAADGRVVDAREVALEGGAHARERVALDAGGEPGLYRLEARLLGAPPGTVDGVRATTGFWIYDRELFESGDDLDFDAFTLRRNGAPEPVVGTTVMSATVHRKFLFEPDAARWDATFAELASIGVNLVRTGVWSGWRKLSLDPHAVDEAWLRALEAYYLSARRHGIAVVFTFFSFVPEAFGGTSPYFDPRALEGQRAYLAAVAARFRGAKEVLWDLINEPSFASPDKLWRCRPHGDRHEAAAFRRWLEQRYGGGDRGWEDVVRARWRLLPDEPVGLPTDADFEDRHVMRDHRPYRAKDWVLFAQDAFGDWVDAMTSALRDAGSRAPVTVGQDEGGLLERPGPLTHHDRVDFTSIHDWWFNDALLWDGLMAKAPGVPLLVSESGVMQRQLLSGEALREPADAAALLSRKLAHAFAAGAFGLVQWCYAVNPYMASDNEVAIGLVRADGSYKPEHRVLRRFAAFVQRNRRWFTRPTAPEVALVLPAADRYGARDLQTAATQRLVRALAGELDVRVQVVAEQRTATDLGSPRLIVLPASRGISDAAWADVRRAVERGAVLHASGWFEADDAGLPAERLGAGRRPLAVREPLDGAPAVPGLGELRYPLAAAESWFAADHGGMPRESALGRGRVLHWALPIEWAEPHFLLRHALATSLSQAGLHAARALDGGRPRPASAAGVAVVSVPYEEATLIAVVNETASPRTVRVPRPGRLDAAAADDGAARVELAPGHAELLLGSTDGRWIDRTDR